MSKLFTNSTRTGLLVAAAALSAFTLHHGPAASREPRPVGAFTELSLGSAARVVVKQGSPQSVVVEAAAADLAEFETTVTGAQLRLGFRQEMGKVFHNRHWGPVTVYVTVPALTALRVGGSGKMQVEGGLKADNLSLAVSGSGRLQVPQLAASRLETTVSGSGDVVVAGTCPRHDVRVSGSGEVQAHDLKSETCDVRVSGSGNAHLFASQSVEARISGSGNVFVAGGARTNSHTSGSGSLRSE